jgi:hypothetical protein
MKRVFLGINLNEDSDLAINVNYGQPEPAFYGQPIVATQPIVYQEPIVVVDPILTTAIIIPPYVKPLNQTLSDSFGRKYNLHGTKVENGTMSDILNYWENRGVSPPEGSYYDLYSTKGLIITNMSTMMFNEFTYDSKFTKCLAEGGNIFTLHHKASESDVGLTVNNGCGKRPAHFGANLYED